MSFASLARHARLLTRAGALAWLVASAWTALPTLAQDQAGCPRCTVGDASDALPGHGALAVPRLQRAVSASFVGAGSYGLNLDPAGPGSTHHRLAGSVGAAVHVVPWLAVGARLNGRYDLVEAAGSSDDGLFGFPTLSLRASAEPFAGFTLGLDVQAMVFGAEAPSFELASTSVLLRALLAYAVDLGGASFVVTFNGGYFLDNSRAAAPRVVTNNLSVQDRVSLGTSDSGAVALGLGGLYAGDGVEVFADVGYRLYVDGAVIGQSPLRVGLGARLWAVPEVLFIGVGVDLRVTPQAASLAAADVTTVPIEPGFTASLSIGARVGAETPASDVVVGDDDAEDDAPSDQDVVPAPTVGSAVGRIADADGSPVAGATIELVSDVDGSRRVGASDGDGRWQIGEVPVGTARYRVTAEGRDPVEGTITITPDGAVETTSLMTRSLPQGEIRGVIQGGDGAPVPARVVIRPIGRELTADAEGSFQVEVPPGEYDVDVSAPGHRAQTRHVTVTERGVVVLNVQLRPGRGRTR